MKAKIAAVGLAHPFEVGYDEADALLDTTVRTLNSIGADCVSVGTVMHDLETVKLAAERLLVTECDVLMVCIATWSEDHHLLDLLSYVDKPVILRAYPARDTGSLCCAHQIGAVFTDIGKSYEFIYGYADDAECAERALRIAAPYSLKSVMSRVRVGAIGGRVKGMTEIAYDEFAIKEKLGARVVNIDEAEMTDIVEKMTDTEAEALLECRSELLAPCKRVSNHESLLESMKYYGAMRALADEYALEALSVKCYTKYMGKVCLGYSILAEESVVASCEGDVTSALAMKMLYELSEKPVNNTDLLYLDEEKNTILFAHCGSSGFSIAGGEIELCPVRLAESGVCSRFVAMPGRVTALNICGHGDKFRMAVMVGEAIPSGMEFPGNPVVIKFDRDVKEINREIMANGIGHHWMVGYGDFSEELERFAEVQNIKFYKL